MIVPICLFSGLANYSTQTLSTFMLPITCFSVCKSYPVLCRSIYSFCVHGISHVQTFQSTLTGHILQQQAYSLNCCSHPMTNRIVFYFLFLSRRLIETPLSSLSLLAHCYQPSKPFQAPASNRVSEAFHSNMQLLYRS